MENRPNAAFTPAVPHPAVTAKRTPRVLAAVLSSIIPGVGHLWLGKTRTGLGFLCAFFLLVLLYWPLGLPGSYVGIQVVIFITTGLSMVAGWHALRTPSQRAIPGSRWWLILLVPIAFRVSSVQEGNLLNVAGFVSFDIPSTAMEPTVLRGDRIIADFRQYRDSKPQPRDIVVIHRDGGFFIKRVVAVGGDTVEGKDDLILVNGHQLNEPYVQHIGNVLHDNLSSKQFGPVKVGQGELFVMGDNRDNSIDSRAAEYGPVTDHDVTAKVSYIVRRPKWWRTGVDRIVEALERLRPRPPNEHPE